MLISDFASVGGRKAPMTRLHDKVSLITGAGSGIGEATALLFAREGARVAVADIDEPAAERTADRIRAEGGEAEARRVDVSDPADTEACARLDPRPLGAH